MSGAMVRVLCRYSEDGSSFYYAGGWQNGTRDMGGDDVIGICRTPRGKRPDSAEDIDTFKLNVDAVATDVRWFKEVL